MDTSTPVPIRILVADDNAADVERYIEILCGFEFEVQTALDEVATLKEVGIFKPHVMIVDPKSMKINEFEVCRQIKDRQLTRGTMVLMIFTLNDERDIERAVEAGTDDLLSKPIDGVELVKRVKNLAKLSHSI